MDSGKQIQGNGSQILPWEKIGTRNGEIYERYWNSNGGPAALKKARRATKQIHIVRSGGNGVMLG